LMALRRSIEAATSAARLKPVTIAGQEVPNHVLKPGHSAAINAQ
jgi:hypothetical protein